MGWWVFVYVFFVWLMLPFYLFEYPSQWFNMAWAVWVISQIIILSALYITNKRRKKAGKCTHWFIPYIISSIIMLLISACIPTAAGSMKGRGIKSYAEAVQEEIKTQLEEELPEEIKQFDKRYDVKVAVEQTVPYTESDAWQEESSGEQRPIQNYYTNLIRVEVKTVAPYGYISQDNVQKLYQEIYKKLSSVKSGSQSYEQYKTECREYRYNKEVNVAEIHNGILILAECPGYRYKAESNSNLVSDDPKEYAYEITDEISGETWYYRDESSNGMTEVDILKERRSKAIEESKAAEEEAKEKAKQKSKSGSQGSSVIHNYSGGGTSAYDKGYDDVYFNGEYNEYRYDNDLDYALGVDDAMEDMDEWY